jgi:nucleotide-binding universal stress UspA family protein
MYRKILVATDGSKLSRAAVRGAVDLASQLGAKLVVFTAVPRYPVSRLETALNVTPPDMDRADREWTAQGRLEIDAAMRMAKAKGVDAKGVLVRSADVAESIIATANKQKCDLIMMASHGRRGLGRLLLGSETQHVLTLGKLPVLVVRPAAGKTR